MPEPVAPARAIFRACVVNAVRNSQGLMESLVAHARDALLQQAQVATEASRRHLVQEAARLLDVHGEAMSKGFPMALLEWVSNASSAASSGSDHPSQGTTAMASLKKSEEWSLMEDDEVEAQVQLSRAQQFVSHSSEMALNELNALVCAAQGLERIRPERNPLRPENYLRALQRVMADTGAIASMRDVWMAPMREQIGLLLTDIYREASEGLRAHGIRPAGFGRSVMPSPAVPWGPSAHAGLHASASRMSSLGDAPSSLSATPMTGWDHSSDAEAEETLLTMGILQQMLMVGGNAYDMVDVVQVDPVSGYASQMAERAAASVGRSGFISAYGGADTSYPASRWANATRTRTQELQSDPAAVSADLITRMMDLIASDARLLQPVRDAVQILETPLRQLVRHDGGFFNDAAHPARRLLDELTERALAYSMTEAVGFSGFMRLIGQAVEHLRQRPSPSARDFQQVLDALRVGWDAHASRMQQMHSQQHSLQAGLQGGRASDATTALGNTSASSLAGAVSVGWSQDAQNRLSAKLAAQIRALPHLEQVPVKAMDFVTGTWATAIARSQLEAVDGAGDDPNGYMAIVPSLFWSVQPTLASTDAHRLQLEVPALRARLQEGLSRVGYPPKQTQDFLRWMDRQHSVALEMAQLLNAPEEPQPVILVPSPPEVRPAPQPAPVAISAAAVLHENDDLPLGSWVILETNRKQVLTQLTWTSPQQTLYLFTGQDGSTQSMTRRMRDRLMTEGMLRRVDPPLPPPTRR